MKAANILLNALNPDNRREMIHKIVIRLRERRTGPERAEIEEWCRSQSRDPGAWASALDRGLWREASDFADRQRRHSERLLAPLNVDLGGGGAYDLLYFLTRLHRPRTVVETGVAAGFSSRAFLSALKKNGSGRLYSSDFPYFRLRSPKQYVGLIVEPELRTDWDLSLKGDRQNLIEIAGKVSSIDLVHYDSDKSSEGRSFALHALGPKLSADALVLFDDIQDNWHFRDLARDRPFLVFPFQGKWVGMVGGRPDYYESSHP